MSENNTDFLNSHSLNFLEMALSTDKIEKVTRPDGYGIKTGDCGDTIECFLIRNGEHIQSVSHWIQGCRYTIACCNTVSRLVEGKTIEAAWDISPDDVKNFLETLPDDHYHCAELAIGALYLALADLKSFRGPYKQRKLI
jgi:nitrogen fixation protein NifU and related proteins